MNRLTPVLQKMDILLSSDAVKQCPDEDSKVQWVVQHCHLVFRKTRAGSDPLSTVSVERKPNVFIRFIRFLGRFTGVSVKQDINEDVAKRLLRLLKESSIDATTPKAKLLQLLIPKKWHEGVEKKRVSDEVMSEPLSKDAHDREVEAFKKNLVAAGERNPQEMYELAMCYLDGVDTDRDVSQAFIAMEQAACRGYDKAVVTYCSMLQGHLSKAEIKRDLRTNQSTQRITFAYEICRRKMGGRFVPAFQGDLSLEGLHTDDRLIPANISPECDVRGSVRFGNGQINRFAFLLTSKFPEVFTLSSQYMESFRSQINQLLDSQLFREQKAIVCPLFMGGTGAGAHITLVYIDREKRTVEYFDSLKNYGQQEKIEETLREIAADISRNDPGESEYRFLPKINKQIQHNGYDCGAYTLFFLDKRLQKSDFEFHSLDPNETKDEIQRYREEITRKLHAMTQHKELDKRLFAMCF